MPKPDYIANRLLRAREQFHETFVKEMGWADTSITEQLVAQYVIAYAIADLTTNNISVDCYQRRD